jgi:hypothetical protein
MTTDEMTTIAEKIAKARQAIDEAYQAREEAEIAHRKAIVAHSDRRSELDKLLAAVSVLHPDEYQAILAKGEEGLR